MQRRQASERPERNADLLLFRGLHEVVAGEREAVALDRQGEDPVAHHQGGGDALDGLGLDGGLNQRDGRDAGDLGQQVADGLLRQAFVAEQLDVEAFLEPVRPVFKDLQFVAAQQAALDQESGQAAGDVLAREGVAWLRFRARGHGAASRRTWTSLTGRMRRVPRPSSRMTWARVISTIRYPSRLPFSL